MRRTAMLWETFVIRFGEAHQPPWSECFKDEIAASFLCALRKA